MKTRLPRPPKGTRCSALSSNAKRCSRPAVVQENYFGEGELYGYFADGGKDRNWVRVAFCEKHADD